MKTSLLVLILVGGFASKSPAQGEAQDLQIYHRAEKASEQNNARQKALMQGDGTSTSTPGAPAEASTSSAPPPPPAKPNSREQAVAKLKADIAQVHLKGAATPEMKAQFAKDLLAASLGSTQPSMSSLTNFSNALLPILANKTVAPTADARLVQNLMVALNSHGLSTERTGEIADEAKTALDKAGADSTATMQVADGMRAIAADVQAEAK